MSSTSPATLSSPRSHSSAPTAASPAGRPELSALRESRLRDAHSARGLWRSLRRASETRREKWAQVQNQLDGGPPFSAAELAANGQGWRCNVNFRDAASTLEQVLVSYWRLLHDTTSLAALTLTGRGDPNAERHEQIFQTCFNRFFDDWGPDYVRNYLLFAQNHITFGVGVAFWNDAFSPRWETVRAGELEVPARAKASVEKLSLVGIRQEMELEALWDLVRTPGKRRAAAERGWAVDELEKLLANELCSRTGDRAAPLSGGDALELQRLLRDDALGATAGRAPLSLVHLLVRDYDGRITRVIFAETLEHNDRFLFDDSRSEGRPESLAHLLGAVFFDAGNGDWWGTKGFGLKNFQTSSVLNRLKSRAVDRTMLDGLNFRDLAEGGRETVPVTNIGPFTFLPKDVEQLPSYPTGRSILETIAMIESNANQNNARYRDASHQVAQSDTATQASILANLQSQIDVANGALYLRQVARNLFTEQLRRLRLRGSDDPDARHFKRRCVDELGMPPEVFHDAELTVRTGADPGAANLALQGEVALQGLALPEANKRWFQEKWVVSKFGAQAVAKALHPVDAASEIKSARAALLENSALGEGTPLPVDPQDNHASHIPQHLQPLEVLVHNFEATGRLDPTALVALQIGLPHLEAHLQFLQQDRLQAPAYQEYSGRFAAVRAKAEALFRHLEKMMHQQQQQQAQAQAMPAQQGQGAPPPEVPPPELQDPQALPMAAYPQ